MFALNNLRSIDRNKTEQLVSVRIVAATTCPAGPRQAPIRQTRHACHVCQ